MKTTSLPILLLGDRSDDVVAHPAIERSLDQLGVPWTWLPSENVGDPTATLARAAGLWCVPGSPYADTDGVLRAIRFARESDLPFLGTCGGFQHLLLECARDLCGTADAGHAELDPDAVDAVCVPLACALRGTLGAVVFEPGSALHTLLGPRCDDVGYNCGYSLAPAWRPRLEAVGLRFTGADATSGDLRAVELPGHPFCIGTLFQPERSILRGTVHALVQAFARAAANAN